ncbi:MAG: hypothetical protein M1814_003939 [Vezdaea aestivalis]|nr:MAG: hypothetical protein M1814_003939 [Vezdaea aestivalis]
MAEKTSALPQRQLSTQSTGSDDAGHQDTSETTGLLLERLQAWKHACGYLENYVVSTERLQKAHAKEYEKLIKSIGDPLREGHHFEQGLGGMSGLIANMRQNTQSIANTHSETEKNLKGSVLPILERLHSEIKSKVKELQTGAGKGIKTVDKARATSQKHIELLAQQSAGYQTHGGKMDPNQDPYVLQRGIYYRLNKQIIEENASRGDVIAVQESFQQFEGHVVETIQKAMSAFNQFVSGQSERQKVLYDDMLGTAQVVPRDFEWKGFVARYNDRLIDPNAPLKTMDNVSFPNQNDRSTQPLVEGTLERKGKLLKSYSAGYYVVTPSHFLHEFKDADNFRADPTPEISLYLPNCTVGALAGLKFNVKGKDTSKGKVGNTFSIDRELVFKALSDHDAKKWYEIIHAAAGGSSSSAPVSPVGSRAASGAQQSLQTQGITGATTTATPTNATPASAVPVSGTQESGVTPLPVTTQTSPLQDVAVKPVSQTPK